MQDCQDDANFVTYVKRSLEEEEEFHFLRFEFLQRLNIVHLQVKLARLKSRIQRDGRLVTKDREILRQALQDYATAIRDYRFLRGQKPVKRIERRDRKLLLERFFQRPDDFNDPFTSHYSFFKDADAQIDPLRAVLMKHLPSRLTFSHEERNQRLKEYQEGKPPNELSAFVDRLVRFIVALVGGSFLVVPMVIMTLQASQKKSLITVSVAVLLFALCLSFGVRVSNVETLVSTATYAAVLVVFVGTSSGNAS